MLQQRKDMSGHNTYIRYTLADIIADTSGYDKTKKGHVEDMEDIQ